MPIPNSWRPEKKVIRHASIVNPFGDSAGKNILLRMISPVNKNPNEAKRIPAIETILIGAMDVDTNPLIA